MTDIPSTSRRSYAVHKQQPVDYKESKQYIRYLLLLTDKLISHDHISDMAIKDLCEHHLEKVSDESKVLTAFQFNPGQFILT